MSNIAKSPSTHKQRRLEKLQEKGLAVSANSISQKTEDKRLQRADRVVNSPSGISESSDTFGKKDADCDTNANTAPSLRIRLNKREERILKQRLLTANNTTSSDSISQNGSLELAAVIEDGVVGGMIGAVIPTPSVPNLEKLREAVRLSKISVHRNKLMNQNAQSNGNAGNSLSSSDMDISETSDEVKPSKSQLHVLHFNKARYSILLQEFQEAHDVDYDSAEESDYDSVVDILKDWRSKIQTKFNDMPRAPYISAENPLTRAVPIDDAPEDSCVSLESSDTQIPNEDRLSTESKLAALREKLLRSKRSQMDTKLAEEIDTFAQGTRAQDLYGPSASESSIGAVPNVQVMTVPSIPSGVFQDGSNGDLHTPRPSFVKEIPKSVPFTFEAVDTLTKTGNAGRDRAFIPPNVSYKDFCFVVSDDESDPIGKDFQDAGVVKRQVSPAGFSQELVNPTVPNVSDKVILAVQQQSLEEKIREMKEKIAARVAAKKKSNYGKSESPAPEDPAYVENNVNSNAPTASGDQKEMGKNSELAAMTSKREDSSESGPLSPHLSAAASPAISGAVVPSSPAGLKAKLEAQILNDEALLSSALQSIASHEEQLVRLTGSVEVASTELQVAQTQVAELENQLQNAKAAMADLTAKHADAVAAVAAIKKTIRNKVNAAGSMREVLNSSRALLLEVSQKLKQLQKQEQLQSVKNGGKRSSPMISDVSKRTKLSDVPQKVVSDDDFVKFTDSDSFGFREASNTMIVDSDEGSSVAETTKERQLKYESLKWEPELTTERLYIIGGDALLCFNEIASLSCLRSTASFLDQSYESKIHSEVHHSGFVPFESPLIHFRSYKYFNSDSQSRSARELGVGNKVNPFKVFCRMETQGSPCNDRECVFQHFRDSSLSGLLIFDVVAKLIHDTENEVVLDLLAHLEWDQSLPLEELRAMIKQSRGMGKTYDDIIRLILDFQQSKGNNRSIIFKDKPSSTPAKAVADANQGNVFRNTHVVSGSTFLEYPPTLPPKNQPIFLQSLNRIVNNEKPKVERYYDAPLAPAEYKALVERESKNVSLQLEYAASLLPENLTMKDLRRSNKDVNNCIDILCEALQENRESHDLWLFYVEFYSRRANSDDVRDIFEQALDFIPDCIPLWWKYVLWEVEKKERERILWRFLMVVVGGQKIQKRQKSRTILAVIMQLANFYNQNFERKNLQRLFLSAFLIAEDLKEVQDMFVALPEDLEDIVFKSYLPPLSECFVSTILTAEDLSLLWLIYIHFLYYGHIPWNVFAPYPYDFLIRTDYFLIKFNSEISSALNTPAGIDIVWFKHLFQNCVDCWGVFVDAMDEDGKREYEIPYLAVVKNFVAFITVRSKPSRVSRFLGAALQERGWCTGLKLLSAPHELDQETIESTTRFGVVNRNAKYLLENGSEDDTSCLAMLLVNSIRICFEDREAVNLSDTENLNETVAEALHLYEVALGMTVDSSASLRSGLSGLKSNIFLWLNFLLLQSIRLPETDSELRTRSSRVVFEFALESVKRRDDRILLWREYLAYEIDAIVGETHKRALAVVWKAVDDLNNNATSEELSAFGLSGFCEFVVSKDYRDSVELIKMILPVLSPGKSVEILEMMKKTNADVLYSCPMFAKYFIEMDAVETAKALLCGSVKLHPNWEWLWRLIYSIETLGGQFGDADSIRKVRAAAKDFLDISFDEDTL
ncbi:Zinc finger C3H1 domain-containing protein [Entophlyctis luteolus]|nr:Zinc finger C3H1 domain-containing protein [Entophlyctis luteolus]